MIPKSDSVYYSDTEALSLTLELDGTADQTFYYSYFYSPDSMFSQKELQAYVYSGSADPVTEDGITKYHFDYDGSGNIAPGYYIIAVSDTSNGDRIIISVCQVV